MNPLFVYGTLKRGYGNNRLLAGQHFVREDFAPGIVYGDGVPIAVPQLLNDKPSWVKGELWLVNDSALGWCDRLEGHPHGYTRTDVLLKSGVHAQIYYWLHPVWADRQPIANGDWKGFSDHRYEAIIPASQKG